MDVAVYVESGQDQANRNHAVSDVGGSMRSPLPLLLAGVIAILAVLTPPPSQPRADEPLIVSPDVMKDFALYKALRKPLYFAVSKDGLFDWYSSCEAYNCQTDQTYRRQAAAECEKEGGAECVIFAVGNDLQVEYRVGDPATMVAAKGTPCTIDGIAAASPAGAIVAQLRPGACSEYRRYGYYGDFKAYASSDPLKSRVARGWSLRYGNPDDAVKEAMDECEKSRKSWGSSDPCELFAIGDIIVRGMTDAQKRAAAEVYKKNKDATNADLPPG
jgi:hypothetical protein